MAREQRKKRRQKSSGAEEWGVQEKPKRRKQPSISKSAAIHQGWHSFSVTYHYHQLWRRHLEPKGGHGRDPWEARSSSIHGGSQGTARPQSWASVHQQGQLRMRSLWGMQDPHTEESPGDTLLEVHRAGSSSPTACPVRAGCLRHVALAVWAGPRATALQLPAVCNLSLWLHSNTMCWVWVDKPHAGTWRSTATACFLPWREKWWAGSREHKAPHLGWSQGLQGQRCNSNMGSIWRHYHRLMEAKPPRSVCPRRRDDAQTYFSGWDVLRWRRKRPSQFSVLPQAVQVTILPVPQRHRALPSPARRPLLVKIARAQIFSKYRRQTVSAMGTSTSVLNNDHCLGQILAHWLYFSYWS